MKIIYNILIIVHSIAFISTQRVAPGVPPQHYGQNQHMPQQMPQQHVPQYQVPVHQQMPVQHEQVQQMPVHQQMPTHQQQIPVHQQPQHQQPHQGQPHQGQPHQGHHAHHAGSQGQILNANIAHEKAHIVEHMEVPMDTSKMSEQELQFHYFKMHDADNNNKLDGCELIKSLIHWHEQGGKDRAEQTHDEKIFKDDELVALIDPILGMDDGNHDGYIDYPEFVRAQQKAATSGKTP